MAVAPDTRRVILLHGVWMVGATMRWMAARLREAGFEPEVFGYHSILGGPAAAVPKLVSLLREKGPAHLVGHSLGGLVALEALAAKAVDMPVARVVCLGTPLCGSRAARVLARRSWTGIYLGRSASLLRQGCVTWPPGIEVGMVAGCVPRGFGALVARFEGAHDGTVSVEETRAPGLAGHVVVEASHTGLLVSRAAAAQVVGFLQTGRFPA
nr:alpha/beta hydrolase [Luteimonas aestuarii]